MNELLLPHQIQMIDQMKSKEETFSTENPEIKSHVGICTNPHGSGKTICVLNHIRNDKSFHPSSPLTVIRTDIMQVIADGFLSRQLIREFPFLDTTLIVANPMILFQWIHEIEKWNLDLNIYVMDRYKKIEERFQFSNYDIIFCYPNLYNSLMESTKKYYWKRFIYDEPFSAKIYSMKKIKVDYLWILCARPYELINYYYRHHFIGFLFSNINENKWLDSILLSTVCNWKITNPTQLYESMNLSICSLYSKINYMSIQYPYDNLESIFTSLEVHQTFDASSFINQLQTTLHHPCCTFQDKSLYCTICLEPIHSDHGYVMSLCCYHLFCPPCFLQWLQLQKGCSVCRTVLTSDLVLYIQSKWKEHKMATPRKTKEIILQEIIFQQYQKDSHLKMIIYASNADIPLLHSVLSFLSDRIHLIQLDGSYVTKWKQLMNWKTMDQASILFITPSTFIIGLNMPEATDLILYTRNCDSKQQVLLSLVQRLPNPVHCQIHLII